jgi:hypothetical protein
MLLMFVAMEFASRSRRARCGRRRTPFDFMSGAS